MRAAIIGLAALLVLVVVVSSYLLLQSCGMRIPFSQKYISICETEQAKLRRTRLTVLELDNAGLSIEIRALERQLAGKQCIANHHPRRLHLLRRLPNQRNPLPQKPKAD